MLRAKKFSDIKSKPLFRFLKEVDLNYNDKVSDKIESLSFYIYYFQLYFMDDFVASVMKNKIFVHKGIDIEYSINREDTTNTWMLVCDKLLVMDIPKDRIEEFCLSYLISPVYRFMIYEYGSGYVVICTSHNRDEVGDILEFQLMNNSKPKYVLLSQYVRPELCDDNGSSFIILNKNVRDCLSDDVRKEDDLYTFYDEIGCGKVRCELDEFVKIIINYTRAFKNYPISYLTV